MFEFGNFLPTQEVNIEKLPRFMNPAPRAKNLDELLIEKQSKLTLKAVPTPVMPPSKAELGSSNMYMDEGTTTALESSQKTVKGRPRMGD